LQGSTGAQIGIQFLQTRKSVLDISDHVLPCALLDAPPSGQPINPVLVCVNTKPYRLLF